jgi:hypothetical protein
MMPAQIVHLGDQRIALHPLQIVIHANLMGPPIQAPGSRSNGSP